MVKKVNAVCGLVIIASVLLHIICVVYCYLTFSYKPLLTNVTAYTVLALTGLHILLSGIIVFFMHDRGRGMIYPCLNVRTLIQRITAVLMILMLILHLNTFKLLSYSAGSNDLLFAAVIILQVLFFGVTLLHTAVSAGNALITLGMISTDKARRNFDITVWIICAVFFAVLTVSVIRTELIMFGGGGV